MELLDKFKQIRTFVFDVDGVLTNGSILITEDGQMLREMNVKDGYALQLAVKLGYRVVIISGGTSESVRVRMEKLGAPDVFLNVKNKKEVLSEYVEKHQISWSTILFMGDDIPDYRVMELVGLPAAPADAAAEIKQLALYISSKPGGAGCVRDVIEKVLKLNGHWPMDTDIASK